MSGITASAPRSLRTAPQAHLIHMRQDRWRRSDDHWNVAAQNGSNGFGAALERNIDKLDPGDFGDLDGGYLEADVGGSVEHAIALPLCFLEEFRPVLHAVSG